MLRGIIVNDDAIYSAIIQTHKTIQSVAVDLASLKSEFAAHVPNINSKTDSINAKFDRRLDDIEHHLDDIKQQNDALKTTADEHSRYVAVGRWVLTRIPATFAFVTAVSGFFYAFGQKIIAYMTSVIR
jgi:predicted PurR-regulated permease PerM